MDFTKTKIEKSNEKVEDDAYIKDIKDRLKIKQNQRVIGSEFDIYYQTQNEDMDKWVNFRMKTSLIFWGNVLIVVATAKFVYPISLKFMKKHLKLQGFLNLNMASVPPILIACGFTSGIYSGAMNIYQFNQEIEEYKK